jgi:phosphoribosylformylglycinamidine synthase
LARFESDLRARALPLCRGGEATEALHLAVTDRQFDNEPVDLPDVRAVRQAAQNASPCRAAGRRLPTILMPAQVSLPDSLERVLTFPLWRPKSFLITIGDRSVTGMVSRDQMVGPWQVPVADCAL